MKDWISINQELPNNGQIVDIKLSNNLIKENVLFTEGRFWKYRKSKSVGQTYTVTFWAAKEKKEQIKKIPEEFDSSIASSKKRKNREKEE